MEFRGPFLIVERTLIVSDLHLGLEDRHLGATGLVARSQAVLDEVRTYTGGVDRIVFNGDVLDDFALSEPRSRMVIGRLLRSFSGAYDTVLVKGNHDPMLASLGAGRVVDSVLVGSVLVTHGDRTLEDVASVEDLRSCSTIVIGHEHPAVTLSDGIRSERFKCFVRIPVVETMAGPREVVVMPSAHPDLVGSDIGSFRSPIIAGEHPEAQVLVASDPVRSFGTIASLTGE